MIYVMYSRGQGLDGRNSQSKAALWLLSRGLDAEYGIRSRPVLIRNSFGKPSLSGNSRIHIGIAHCRGAVATILSDSPVGIDIEEVRPFDVRTARRVLGERELDELLRSGDPDRSFFRYWTLKESYVKALGCGLSYPLKNLEFRFGGDGSIQTNVNASFKLREGPEGFILAVCRLGRKDNEAGENPERVFSMP